MSFSEKLDKSKLESNTGGSGLHDSPRKRTSQALAPTSSHRQFGVSPRLDRVTDGEAVYVQLFSNQVASQEVSQPRVFEVPLLDGLSFIEAEWEYEEFVWLSDFLDRLPSEYLLLLEFLEVSEEDYSLTLEGFYCYHHAGSDFNDESSDFRKCSVKRIFVPVVKAGRYHPYTSVKHRCRASSQALERLEFLEAECCKRRVKFDYLVKIDLTLPKQVSELWDSKKTELNISRAVRDFLDLLHGKLFKHNSRFGAIANHHYWATRSPLTPHRHIHLTIPNVCYNPLTDMFHRFRPYIDADLVKEAWREALKRNGLWVDVPDHVKPDVYVGYIEFEDRAKVLHRLSYCCRKPVEDLVKNLSNSDLTSFNEDFARFLLDYTPRRINLGYLTNLKRFGYSNKRLPLKCPICGGDMYPERDKFGHAKLYDRPPPDIPRLYQERTGEWRRFSKRG